MSTLALLLAVVVLAALVAEGYRVAEARYRERMEAREEGDEPGGRVVRIDEFTRRGRAA